MTGQEYLENIKTQLEEGRRQNRKGENVLRAFGYVRRRATAINEIGETLERVGLVAVPPISSDMPLKERIIFRLKSKSGIEQPEAEEDTRSENGPDSTSEEEDEVEEGDNDINLPEPAFRVSELASAKVEIEWVSPNESIQKAYTKMVLSKYSQLLVANSATPRQQDVKGTVSFKSIAKALINGDPKTVGDCLDREVPFANVSDDLSQILLKLIDDDVVLVIGQNKRLQGIVTAWDLAEEFAGLVDPFKRIEEIEERLRALVRTRLGKDKVIKFLSDHGIFGKRPVAELDDLTMGELQMVLGSPEHWDKLGLVFDRAVFIKALDEARDFRNRLMHFRDPLDEAEKKRLSDFCDAVREIQL